MQKGTSSAHGYSGIAGADEHCWLCLPQHISHCWAVGMNLPKQTPPGREIPKPHLHPASRISALPCGKKLWMPLWSRRTHELTVTELQPPRCHECHRCRTHSPHGDTPGLELAQTCCDAPSSFPGTLQDRCIDFKGRGCYLLQSRLPAERFSLQGSLPTSDKAKRRQHQTEVREQLLLYISCEGQQFSDTALPREL